MMLIIENVSKTFNRYSVNEKKALSNIHLSLKKGDFVVVIGSNGAGKSTLMNVVAGVFPVDEGKVYIDGEDVTNKKEFQRARYIGRVFQDPMAGTAPTMTIAENMAMAFRRGERRGLTSSLHRKNRDRFREALRELELGLEDRMETKVGTLSGGERQALSLLMATFTEPKILLLDEHTAALDPKRAELILNLTKKFIEHHLLTTLMITHNMEHALRMGNRLVMMHAGEIVINLTQEEKGKMRVRDLIDAFEQVRGEKFADDRVVLG